MNERQQIVLSLLIGFVIGYGMCWAMDAVRARHILAPAAAASQVDSLHLQATAPDTFALIDCRRRRPPCASAE